MARTRWFARSRSGIASFATGGGSVLFLCPACGGRRSCSSCMTGGCGAAIVSGGSGVQFRIAYGTRAERAEARAQRIEKLKAKLVGGPLRVRPKPGLTVARRRELELSLRRALIREREKLLEAET